MHERTDAASPINSSDSILRRQYVRIFNLSVPFKCHTALQLTNKLYSILLSQTKFCETELVNDPFPQSLTKHCASNKR